MRFLLPTLLPLALALGGCAETNYYSQSHEPPPPPPPGYANPSTPPPTPPQPEPQYQPAQPSPQPPPPPAAQPAAADAALSPVDQLVAPIALYPDPIVSLVLPASTFPDQVQAAGSYLQSGGSPDQVDSMAWDYSVRGLAHYANVTEWMAANPDWTNQLGGAFASNPAAVMDSIQTLRRRAMAEGSLVQSAQQDVVETDGMIEIEPASMEQIYVPEYDPSVVFTDQPPGFDYGSCIAWGDPYYAGDWLQFDFDWRSHRIWRGNWYAYHRDHGGWQRPVNYAQVGYNGRAENVASVSITVNNFQAQGWGPPAHHPAPPPQLSVQVDARGLPPAQAHFAQPHPPTGAPAGPAGAHRSQAIEQERRNAPASPRPAAHPTPNPQGPHPQAARPQTPSAPQSQAERARQEPAQRSQADEQQRTQQARAQQEQHAQQQKAEQAHADQQKAEQERSEQARAEQEKARQGQQRAEEQKAEQARNAQQKAEQERVQQQKAAEQQRERVEPPQTHQDQEHRPQQPAPQTGGGSPQAPSEMHPGQQPQNKQGQKQPAPKPPPPKNPDQDHPQQ